MTEFTLDTGGEVKIGHPATALTDAAAFAAAAMLDGGADWTRAVENAGFTVLQAV